MNYEKSIKFVKQLNLDNMNYVVEDEFLELMNKFKDKFFTNISKEVLKKIPHKIFSKISEKCIKDLSKKNLELLANINLINYFPEKLLDKRKDFEDLSSSFYEKIDVKFYKNLNEKKLIKMVEKKIISNLPNNALKYICDKINFNESFLESWFQSKKPIIINLLNELNYRNKLNYLTQESIISLKKYINEMSYEILTNLKNSTLKKYIENNDDDLSFIINTNKRKEYDNYEDSILNKKDIGDIFNDVNQLIKPDEIPIKIGTFLQQENFLDLRDYCFRCCRKFTNRDIMISTLYEFLYEGNNHIYYKLDKIEILIILIIVEKGENSINNYKKLIELIKNISESELEETDEYISRINKFSEITKQINIFDINFLEKVAQINLRNIKSFIEIFYKGADKDSVDTYLKEKYVEILNDYIRIIVKKYKIDQKKILENLKNIIEEECNIEERLDIYIQSLNVHEQLFYDLFIQSIIEKPDSESKIKSWATPIFKIIRDTIGTVLGTRLCSLTGSKILSTITASVGTAFIIKDIQEMVLNKSYFGSEKYRKIYHMNKKNNCENRFVIFKRKIKEKTKKIINPIKNFFYSFIDKKILNLKEEIKIGFDCNYDMNNIEEEAKNFKKNFINDYFIRLEQLINIKFFERLSKMQKKYEKKQKNEKVKKIKDFSKVKEEMIERIFEIELGELEKLFPEFKRESTCEKTKNFFKNGWSNVKVLFKTLVKVTTNGLFYGEPNEKTDSEIRLELIKNLKYREFLDKSNKINENRQKDLYQVLYDEVKSMSNLTNKDKILFSFLEKIKEAEEIEFKNEKSILENENLIIVHKEKKKENEKEKEKEKEELFKSDLCERLIEENDDDDDEIIDIPNVFTF